MALTTTEQIRTFDNYLFAFTCWAYYNVGNWKLLGKGFLGANEKYKRELRNWFFLWSYSINSRAEESSDICGTRAGRVRISKHQQKLSNIFDTSQISYQILHAGDTVV